MIESAAEFARLRRSTVPAEYERAGVEEAPLEVWFEVIEHFPELREWVAHNKSVPLPILERLSNDPSVGVRATVASKRKLSTELRMRLAYDPDASVRERVACNAKCELEILRLLSADQEPFVRAAATSRLQGRADAI